MTQNQNSSTALTARPPIRCIIVQLARLGDTLQTLMALRAAKQLYPQLEFTVIVRDSFAAAAHRVPWIHQVHELPTGALVGDVLSGSLSEINAIPGLARWIAPLVSQPWDYAINWTYSESSSWLTGLLPARVKLGFSRRKDQTLSASDGWTHYVQAVVQGQLPQNIHLTDILTTQLLTALQIHIGDPDTDAGNTPVSRGFFDFSQEGFKFKHSELQGKIWRDPSRKWITFQIGAGHPSKTLSPSDWAELISTFRAKRPELNLLVLGGKGEINQQSEIKENLARRGISLQGIAFLAGETDFELWASLIERSHWLLSGDTSAVHLASIVGTRVLNLSLGNVRYMETGPYGNGHVVVRPMESSILSGTTPLIFDIWEYHSSDFRNQKSLTLHYHLETEGHSRDQIQSYQVYRSRVRDADSGGGVSYEPVLHDRLSFNEWVSQVTGYIARAWYCGWTPAIGHELNRDQVKSELLRDVRQLAEPIDVLIKICEEAKRTALSLQRKVGSLRSQKIMGLESRKSLQEQADKLMELEKLIERLVIAQPALALFFRLAKVSMHNLNGEDIGELGKQTAAVYHRLSQGAQFYKDWVNHLLQLSRPKIVESTAKVIPIEFKNSIRQKPENEVTP